MSTNLRAQLEARFDQSDPTKHSRDCKLTGWYVVGLLWPQIEAALTAKDEACKAAVEKARREDRTLANMLITLSRQFPDNSMEAVAMHKAAARLTAQQDRGSLTQT